MNDTHKRDPSRRQKRPTTLTYNRDPSLCQKTPTTLTKETHRTDKSDLPEAINHSPPLTISSRPVSFYARFFLFTFWIFFPAHFFFPSFFSPRAAEHGTFLSDADEDDVEEEQEEEEEDEEGESREGGLG